MEFKHIYQCEPIDYWEKAELADDIITKAVLKQMPDEPRDGCVYKLLIPDPPGLTEIYLCKADNNGTVYIFSDVDLIWAIRWLVEY